MRVLRTLLQVLALRLFGVYGQRAGALAYLEARVRPLTLAAVHEARRGVGVERPAHCGLRDAADGVQLCWSPFPRNVLQLTVECGGKLMRVGSLLHAVA